MTTCIVHSPDDKCPLAPLASCAASVDTPTPSPYATDSCSFQLPITVPWHHGSNPRQYPLKIANCFHPPCIKRPR